MFNEHTAAQSIAAFLVENKWFHFSWIFCFAAEWVTFFGRSKDYIYFYILQYIELLEIAKNIRDKVKYHKMLKLSATLVRDTMFRVSL